MKSSLLDILCCFKCGNEFELKILQATNETEIEEGLLTCKCGETFPIVRSVPRILPNAFRMNPDFVNKYETVLQEIVPQTKPIDLKFYRLHKDTQKKFGLQWAKWGTADKIYGKTKKDMYNCLFDSLSRSVITPEYLKGKVVLDAGCGHGRYVEIMSELGAEVVGLDIGEGIDVARTRTKNLATAHLVQGNMLEPPFKTSSFDYILASGSTHHTPDTRLAFNKLAKLVKPCGIFDIHVYPKESFLFETIHGLIRGITTKLPERFLYYLCFIPVPLLSIAKTYSGTSLRNSSWRECAQAIYDWYSPKYQWHHTEEEVSKWFEEEGFHNLELLPYPGTGVSGIRRID